MLITLIKLEIHLLLDKTNSYEEALIKIFERLRPGEPPTVEAAQALFDSLIL